MRAICAWCRAEGSPADLGEREPLEDASETHGICQRHLTRLLSAVRARPLAGLGFLIVVKRSDESLHEHLIRAMAGVEGVHVIVDGRHGERRKGARSTPKERRHAERRQSRGVVHSIGCTFVKFPPTQRALGAL